MATMTRDEQTKRVSMLGHLSTHRIAQVSIKKTVSARRSANQIHAPIAVSQWVRGSSLVELRMRPQVKCFNVALVYPNTSERVASQRKDPSRPLTMAMKPGR